MNSEKDYLSLPMREFLADTAARSPTPGGGSVAALVGALSASLARMAIAYTAGKPLTRDGRRGDSLLDAKRPSRVKGKPPVAAHEARLRELLDELARAGEMFGQLMAEDMAAYERFAASKKSVDPQERQRALATAIAVPMEIIVLAGAVAARLDEVKSLVSRYLLSDLQTAAILSYAAARSACTNVRMNIAELQDRKEAARLESQLDLLVGRTARHRNAVVHYQEAGH